MADRLVRVNTTYQASGTSISAVFDQPTPLDSTYLLVASINLASSTVINTPSGWTEISGGGFSGANQTRIYVKQGDGSTNSISVTVASAAATLTLSAFSGFVSLTPLWSAGGAGTSSTSMPATVPSGYTYGVAIVAVGLSSTTTAWGSWSNATRTGTIVNASQRLDTARAEYTGPQIDASISWAGARTPRVLGVILPLMPTPMSEYGFNEGSGTTTLDSSGNGHTLTVNSNAWNASGRTGSAVSGSSTGITLQSTGLPITSIDGYTMTCWAYVTSTNTDAFGDASQLLMYSKSPDGTDFTGFYLNRTGGAGSTFNVGVYSESAGDTGTYGSFSLNAWHHFAFTFDEVSTTIYVDGVQIYTDAVGRYVFPDRTILGNGDVTPGAQYSATLQGKIDEFRSFPYRLSLDQILIYKNMPVYSTSLPRIVGVETGEIVDAGSVSITPPAGAEGYLAIVSTGTSTPAASNAPNPTAPSGFTLYQSGYNSYTAWRIYIGTAGAGSNWQTTVGWSTSIMVIGLTAFEIDAYANGGEQNANPTPDQTAPSVTTTKPALVMRLETAAPWPGPPTGTYPIEAPDNRNIVYTPNNEEGTVVVLATSDKQVAGATGTASFSFSPLDGSTVHTLALRKPTRTITYFDSEWANSGSGTGDGLTVYKQVVLTGCQPGDVIVAFGAIENLNTNGTRYVWDVTAGGPKTGSWTELSGMTGLVDDEDVDFYAGHAVVTTAGTITVQVGLRNSTNGHMGVGAYLIPSSMITGSYGFIGNGFIGSSSSLASATLSSNATVIYMATDWVAQTMGSTPTPSGGTILRSYSDSAYAVWTGMWSSQTAGTRNYGPNGLSGRKTAGVLFTLSETSAPTSSRWYTHSGTLLKPYRLTGSGLIELQ